MLRLRLQEAATYVQKCVRFYLVLLSNEIWEVSYKFHLRVGRRIEGRLLDTSKILFNVVRNYRPKPYSGRVVIIRCESRPEGRFRDDEFGWSGLAVGGLELHFVPGNHVDMFREPNVETLANTLRACLDTALETSAGSS